MVKGSYGEAFSRQLGNEMYYNFGMAANVNLKQICDTPIGFVLGYKQSSIPDRGEEVISNAQSFLFNISYTGRQDFIMGLDLDYKKVPLIGFVNEIDFLGICT